MEYKFEKERKDYNSKYCLLEDQHNQLKQKFNDEQYNFISKDKELQNSIKKQKQLVKELTENEIQLSKYSKRLN